MRTLLALVRKEFLQIFRDPATVFQVFLIPVVQLIVLSNAATFEITRSRVLVVDQDHTAASASLAARLDGNDRFLVTRVVPTIEPIETAFRRGEASLVLVIPRGFEQDLALELEEIGVVGRHPEQRVGFRRGLVDVLADFAAAARAAPRSRLLAPSVLDLRARAWYNPTGNYKHYMVPGLLVSLTTIIGLLLTAQNITREKELGTLDQLNVTPVRRWQIIASKLLPFWLLALLIFTANHIADFGFAVALAYVFAFAEIEPEFVFVQRAHRHFDGFAPVRQDDGFVGNNRAEVFANRFLDALFVAILVNDAFAL